MRPDVDWTAVVEAVVFYKLYQNGWWDDDWGTILAHGLELGRTPLQELLLGRTGPFAPKVTLPDGHVLVIADSIRSELDAGILGPIVLRHVVKAKVVYSNWETMDPRVRPHSGEWEPEDVIINGLHSVDVSTQMDELWEVVSETADEARIVGRVSTSRRIVIDDRTWDGRHIFNVSLQPTGRRYGLFVTELARSWIERHAKEWFEFEPCTHCA